MTLLELMKVLDEKVAKGEITKKDRADAIAKWQLEQEQETVPALLSDGFEAKSSIDVTSPPLNRIVSDLESASPEDLEAIAGNFSGTESEDKQKAALEEINKRAKIQDASFLESLILPGGAERFAKSVAKGPAQMIMGVTEGMPALLLSGIAGLTKSETAADAASSMFDKMSETNQTINENFGASDALNPTESLAENILTALVPGGLAAKSASVATDFAVDQTMRELMDTNEDTYSTVFDRMGWKDSDSPSIPAWAMLPAAMATGFLASGALNKMRNTTVINPPTLKSVHDFDKFAPPDLKTLEKSSDAWKAYVIDEQEALTTIVKRAGLPNPDEVAKTITVDTHASANTRAREAITNGSISVNGKSYKVPVPVKTVFDAAMQLPQEVRLKVERYLNLYDMLDDSRIALAEAMKPNSPTAGDIPKLQGAIATHAAELGRIARDTPIAKKFHATYKAATQAVRDFLEGDILDTNSKTWLDTNRQNYVPLDISAVDKTAPFMERLIQSQQTGIIDPDDWFLRGRASQGTYNIDFRGNPFELLADYTESAMHLAMNNDARLKIIDGLLNSQFGKDTIRLVKESDDLAGNVDRIVEVYRAGTKEKYITSKLTAQLMKFDPYVAKHPWAFLPKRLFEHSATGPLSLTFAPITAIRDTIAGAVLAPKDLSVAGPIDVMKAVPKQLWAKAQGAISQRILADIAGDNPTIPEALWSKQGQLAFANKLSNNYMNTVYHLANEGGGFDASIMKNNIVAAQSVMGEIKRSIRESAFMHSPLMRNAVTRFGGRAVSTMIDGFVALFDSIQDAPRFAALEKSVKKGMSVDDAAIAARQLTGDTTRSGRAFSPDGKLMGVDAVDRGITTLVNPLVANASTFIREATPYFNPMIQGTKRLITAFKDDPVGTYAKGWMYVGLPAFAAYSWNEMAGPEYNEYAMSRRSSRDVAMNLYIGIPGKPPEEGIEIPLPHELVLFNSPFTRFIHGLKEGEDADEMSFAMQKLGIEILSNSVMISSPVVINNVLALAGQSAPTGFLGLGGSYETKEDFSGFIPQNLENLLRSQFSTTANLGMQIAYAMSEEEGDNDWNNLITTVVKDVQGRLPIVRKGIKTANTSFSIPAAYDRAKSQAMEDFWPYWDRYYNPEKMLGDDLHAMRQTMSKTKGVVDEENAIPPVMIGPGMVEKPTNPLYDIVGEELIENARRNNIGLSGVQDYITYYSKMVSILRKYNEGDKKALGEWEEALKSSDVGGWGEQMKELMTKWNVDLSDYSDRVKLINIIENEKSLLISQKLELFGMVEKSVTKKLLEQGLIEEGEEFRIDKHLRPFDDNPLGIKDALTTGGLSLAIPELASSNEAQ